MPKISNNPRRVNKEYYEVEVWYNQDHHFYAKIPKDLTDTFDALYKDYSNKEAGCEITKKGDRIVSASTESKCLEKWDEVIRKLQETSIQEKPVIILYYEKRTINYSGRIYNPDHENIDMSIAMVYAIESTVPGKNPRWFREKTIDSWLSENKVYRDEIHIGQNRKSEVIIDDTPENRLFLERIYEGIKQLKSEMDKYTESPETLLQLIASKQKLIG